MASWRVVLYENDNPRDFGVIEAAGKDAAERQVLKEYFPEERQDWDYLQGCMSAKKVG